MAKLKMNTYWILLLVVLFLGSSVMSVGQTQARYTGDTTVVNTVMLTGSEKLTSNLLVSNVRQVILLGELESFRSVEVTFTLKALQPIKDTIYWYLTENDVIAVQLAFEMTKGEGKLHDDATLEMEMDSEAKVKMTITSISEILDERNVDVVVLCENLSGTFRVTLTPGEDDPTEPTEGENTEPTDPTEGENTEPTDPAEGENTEPTDPTEGENTEPTDPAEGENTEPTDPAEGENTEPTDPAEGENTEPTDPTEGENTELTDPTEGENTEPTDSTEGTEPVEASEGTETEPMDPADDGTGDSAAEPVTEATPDPQPTDPKSGEAGTEPVTENENNGGNTGESTGEPTDDTDNETGDNTETPSEGTGDNTETPGEGTGDNTETPGEGTGDNTETPGEGTGDNTETPGEGTGDNTETPGEGTGDNTETPGEGTGDNTETPGEGTGDNTETPGEGTGDNTETPGEGTDNPPDNPDGEQETDAVSQVLLKTFLEFERTSTLPVSIVVGGQADSLRIGLAEGKPLPALTRYSPNGGDTWYLLYFGGYITIDDGFEALEVAEALTWFLLMDFSETALETGKEFTLEARGMMGEQVSGTAALTTKMAADTAGTDTPQILTKAKPAEAAAAAVAEATETQPQAEPEKGSYFVLKLPIGWDACLVEYEAEFLQAGEKGNAYQPVDIMYIVDGSEEQKPAGLYGKLDYQARTLTIGLGEELPAAGTYRLTIRGSYEGVCFQQMQMTFFVNYTTRSDAE